MLWGGWGERKRERAGHYGKEEERREAAPTVSLFPSSPARFLFFRLFYFDGDTQREPLRRRELQVREESGLPVRLFKNEFTPQKQNEMF